MNVFDQDDNTTKTRGGATGEREGIFRKMLGPKREGEKWEQRTNSTRT